MFIQVYKQRNDEKKIYFQKFFILFMNIAFNKPDKLPSVTKTRKITNGPFPTINPRSSHVTRARRFLFLFLVSADTLTFLAYARTASRRTLRINLLAGLLRRDSPPTQLRARLHFCHLCSPSYRLLARPDTRH